LHHRDTEDPVAARRRLGVFARRRVPRYGVRCRCSFLVLCTHRWNRKSLPTSKAENFIATAMSPSRSAAPRDWRQDWRPPGIRLRLFGSDLPVTNNPELDRKERHFAKTPTRRHAATPTPNRLCASVVKFPSVPAYPPPRPLDCENNHESNSGSAYAKSHELCPTPGYSVYRGWLPAFSIISIIDLLHSTGTVESLAP
jgi:hypothetical protein